jgi:cytoskeletal protein CcmA (bactofilin family)
MSFRAAAILSLFLILPTSACKAVDFQSAENYRVADNQTTTNELWVQARTVNFSGLAEDDCFLLADSINQATPTNPATVRLPGIFKSDLWAAGESVDMTGVTSHHARLAALKTCTVNGSIGRNLMAFAPTLVLGTNTTVGGDLFLVGQDIIVGGTISGNSRILGTKVTLAGRFNGNLNVTASDITVTPGTRIAGNLVYRMDRDLVLDSRVELGGKMIRQEILEPEAAAPITSADLILQLALLSGAIMVGLVFVSLMPGVVALSVHKLSESIWRCILFGFVTFALVPMMAFFLLFTLIGIPLSIMLILAYTLLMYVSKIITGLFVGHLLLRRKTPIPPNLLFPVMALGLLILYAASSLPFPFGILFWFIMTLAGMGALVGAILDRRIPVMVSYAKDTETKPPPLPGNFPPGAV